MSKARRERGPRPYGKADLHIHSLASDGLNSAAEILAHVEEHTDLDVIAITDHDEIEGALQARQLWERGGYSFEVVVGEEITTLSGHIVALGIQRLIRMFQPLDRTLMEIHAQGGLAVIPHPLAWYAAGLSRWRIEKTLQQRDKHAYFDAIEVFNPSFAGRQSNTEVAAFNNKRLHLPGVAGSDSHALHTIGTAYTVFAGRTWADLRTAIQQGTTQSEGVFWNLADHSSIAVPQAVRSLIILPGKRIKKLAGWVMDALGLAGS